MVDFECESITLSHIRPLTGPRKSKFIRHNGAPVLEKLWTFASLPLSTPDQYSNVLVTDFIRLTPGLLPWNRCNAARLSAEGMTTPYANIKHELTTERLLRCR
ncbi:unnamed protein product [Hymenolepis diminuta]|uniref:Uncharacterized protein n=1 Tax=Hymenolepis diminuta TaxID=6216 RepID=A0A564YWV2_HYMDI|nr:unnamed protein product [Hymenolepis diminuta]